VIRCLLVDDHPVMRTGCRRLLELDGFAVCGEAADADSAYKLFCAERPDLTITDASLPGASGFELARRIRAREPAAKVLVFSMLEAAVALPAARSAGADGFVAKDSPPDELVDAARAVHAGRSWWPAGEGEDWRLREYARLSPREAEVLRLLARGNSPEVCAEALHVSRKTVANYQSLIRDKLGLDNGAELAHFALRHGIIDAPQSLAAGFAARLSTRSPRASP
jgi:DNA-binding NarL/FixJ family response regulator